MRDAKPQRLIKALESEGFVKVSHNNHLKMSNGTVTLVVPTHGIVKSKTVARIQKQSGIDKRKFYGYTF